MSGIRSPLANLLPSRTSPEELEEIKRNGWLEHRILVVNLNDPRLDWIQAQQVQMLGRKLYGDFLKKGKDEK